MSADNRSLETLGQLTCQKAFDEFIKDALKHVYVIGGRSELVVERCVLGRKDSVKINPLGELNQLDSREPLDFFIRDLLTADE